MGIISCQQGSIETRDACQGGHQKRRPTVEIGLCTRCGGCLEVAPDVFRMNDAAGYVEVCDLEYYDPQLVDEAIKNCPEDCIFWEDD